MPRSIAGSLTLALAAGLMSTALAGCQIAGFIMETFEKVPAAYEPEDRKTVVVIDDPNDILPTARTRGVIAQTIGRDLETQEVITDFVPPGDVDHLRLNNDEFDNWPIDRIGKETDAEQVLYVLIENFGLRGSGQGHQTYRPIASARVKLVDVTSGVRLFPGGNASGHPVIARMSYKQNAIDTEATRVEIRQQLAARLADRISKLFYEHPPDDVGEDFPD